LRAVDRYRATVMVGTVENYLELLDRPDLADYDLSSLSDPSAVSFVRKLDPEVRRRWSEAVGPGSVLREAAYGLTETHTFDATPYGMAEGDRDLLAEPVFCGVPVPGTDIAVVSFETGEPVPLGTEGEIVVRSPSVTTGYWNKPEATARQLRGGWLHTGDNGRIDEDGCLHYLGRDKDLIKVKGMSVFPAEVEVLLGRHPGVASAAVVAAEDPDSGQRPVAFVVPAAGTELDAEELRAWAARNMAPYKVPLVEVVERFPMTATGKVRKVDLAEQGGKAAEGAARGAAPAGRGRRPGAPAGAALQGGAGRADARGFGAPAAPCPGAAAVPTAGTLPPGAACRAARAGAVRVRAPASPLLLLQDLQVVRVVHDAQQVAEGVHHRGGDEPGAALGHPLVLLGAHRQQPLERGLDVVDVPVEHGAAGAAGRCRRAEPAVDEPQLVLVVADPELHVGQLSVRAGALEVRGGVEQLGVPLLGRLEVVGPEVDGGESAKHGVFSIGFRSAAGRRGCGGPRPVLRSER